MKKITELAPGLHYVGANDRTTQRFEALWSLPYGVSYNSYLLVAGRGGPGGEGRAGRGGAQGRRW